jgi:hypothetical protein
VSVYTDGLIFLDITFLLAFHFRMPLLPKSLCTIAVLIRFHLAVNNVTVP